MAHPPQHIPPQQHVPPQPARYAHQQHSPSPSNTQLTHPPPGFALSQPKRPQAQPQQQQQHYSHPQPQPQQAYSQQPYSPQAHSPLPSPSPHIQHHSYSAMSPTNATPTSAPSPATPAYASIQPTTTQAPQYGGSSYHTTNGAPMQSPNMPAGRPHPISNMQPGRAHQMPLSAAPPTLNTPQTPGTPGTPGTGPYYTPAAFVIAPVNTAPPTPGSMGPPSKPADKPAREYEYEVMDSLQGTGVNIRDEENALNDYYAGAFALDSRTGLAANAPGNRASFYGAGFANQPGQVANVSQKEAEAAVAERAFIESAARLSAQRAREDNAPFLQYSTLHYKANKMAKEYGLDLNLDMKNPPVLKSRHPTEYNTAPQIKVSTKVGPDGAMIATYGSVMPPESYLIDQLALLSISTKQRLRDFIEDMDKVATTRQQTSHGVIPEEWADVAVPLNGTDAVAGNDASPQTGVDSAVSPRTNPLKRSFDASNSQASARNGKLSTAPVNHIAKVFREESKAEREAEELRLKKRQKRLDAAAGGSRSGSIAPGTPGATAPELEKAPTKKELKKVEKSRQEASSAANVNKTTMQFLGGQKKKYSWMTAGAGGGGASTPSRLQTQGLPGTSGTPAAKAPENTNLTQEGRRTMGMWREYGEKGKNIQLRDLVVALERDGREKTALQRAYLKLDDADK